MLEVDFHSHTHFSQCGLHSVIEMLTAAKKLGLTALALTDHGPVLKSTTPSTFFDRLFDPVPGIRLIKGMECNIAGENGEIDFPMRYLQWVDIVLLGLHPHLPKKQTVAHNTGLLIRALEKNAFVDIVTHPEDVEYPVDFKELALFAKEHGVALECNNSKILNNRVSKELMMEYLAVCNSVGCLIAINSDAHAIGEIGLDNSVRPLLQTVGFPENRIVNQTANSAFEFMEKRKAIKKRILDSNKGK